MARSSAFGKPRKSTTARLLCVCVAATRMSSAAKPVRPALACRIAATFRRSSIQTSTDSIAAELPSPSRKTMARAASGSCVPRAR
jgi:hypothetical protein